MWAARSRGLLLGDPALEADLEDGDASLGREARGRLGDAARAERLRDRHREGGELDELALLDVGVLRDERVARTHEVEVAAVLELGARRLEGSGDGVERARLFGGALDAVDDALLELLRPGEQHLALVGEVAEEGSLREAGARGDLLDRRASSYPRSWKSSIAAFSSRPRASGSQRAIVAILRDCRH
jgi:hypothetical protein